MIVRSRAVQEQFEFNDSDQVWEAFQGWYYKGEYFDAKISCKDGVDVDAHKFFLAALSEYFSAAFLGEMNKNVNGLVTTHLEFLSSSVKFYTNCLYQRHGEADFDIDILDFVALCDYVGDSCFHRIGLRIAAQKLTTENAFSELKDIVSGASDPVPNWLPTVTHFINVSLEDKLMDITKLSVYEPSPQSLISLLSSASASACSNCVVLELIRLLTDQEHYCSPQELEMILPHILRLVNEKLNESEDMVKVQPLVEKLNERCMQPGSSIVSSFDKHFHTSALPYSSDEEVMLQIPCNRAALDFVFFSKKMELSDGDFELGRFTSSLLDIGSDMLHNLKGNIHGLRLRFFVWKMFICVVFVDILVGLRVLKYSWMSSEWIPLATVEIERACNFEIRSCSAVQNKLTLLLLEEIDGIPQRRPIIYKVELGKPNTSMVLKSFHRRHAGMRIVDHQGLQLGFVTPHSYIDVTDLSTEGTEILITDSVETTSLGIMLSFKNKILHFYNGVQDPGIFVDELVLKKSTYEWERHTRKLSDSMQLVDAFEANGEVFVVYKKVEDIGEPLMDDFNPSDDEDHVGDFFSSDVESDPEYEDNDREMVYLSKCSFKEVEHGKYVLTLSEDGKEVGPMYCSKDCERIVVKRSVFPLDMLPYQ